jgi:translation initiation factor IF-2
MARMQSKAAARETVEEDEEPTERVLKSRKFRDDEPRKEKPARRGRRGDDEDDDRGDRRSRRDRDFEEDVEIDRRGARKANRKEAKEAEKKAQRAAERAAQQAEQKNQIKLPEFISVQNLAQALGVRYEQFVTRLEDLGYDDIFPGKIFNTEVSGMIAMEYEMEPVFDSSIREEEERDLKARPAVDEQEKDLLPTRPPVVTIMGHVDHGKTTILDYLRKSSVAAGEAGGITQHIGAFSVPLAASGKTVTFLDTPGHAAFLAMRQRGANVTDIVILVVAADDSVKPQTLEAIKHAKSAGVPMLVAINKCDKESADVQRVKQDLARHGVEIEDFGGDTQVVQVSGKTGLGMDELEEAAVTLSEILDHRADTEGAVEGWVLEATTKPAGRVATVLVRRGTLRQGVVIVAGKTWARVRSLHNEAGVAITEAGPGMPVEVDGWRDQPAAGDEVLQAPTEQKATSVVEYRLEKVEREKTAEDMEVINEARRLQAEKREQDKAAAQKAKQRESGEDEAAAAAEVEAKAEPASTASGRIEVPFLIKADVSGSAEAVEAYIMSVSSPMVAPRILYSSVGAMHESDIELAATTGGHIIAFNIPPNEGLKAMALSKGVKVLENNIIYRVLDDVRSVLEEKLPPIITQRVLGEAEIGAAFEIGVGGRKKVKIAGCKIRNGVIGSNARVRVMRGEEKVYDGSISSLKNVKKDVQEMRKGSECGMGFDGWEAFEVGDQIQTYEERSEKRTL